MKGEVREADYTRRVAAWSGACGSRPGQARDPGARCRRARARAHEPDAWARQIHRMVHQTAGGLLRISANVTDDFGNVTGLSGRCW